MFLVHESFFLTWHKILFATTSDGWMDGWMDVRVVIFLILKSVFKDNFYVVGKV
jgi:hypothetical protein